MGINPINPNAIKESVKASSIKASTSKNFDAFLGATNAMSDTAAVSANQSGAGVTASTVLASAFSGIGELSSLRGGSGVPSYSSAMLTGGVSGYSGSYGSFKASGGYSTGSSSIMPGTDYSQADMINTMNQNNLQLLELQATMQSNMQAWNTKSNILSADHRARMAMIEKFTARG